jgi:hypothetical protein
MDGRTDIRTNLQGLPPRLWRLRNPPVPGYRRDHFGGAGMAEEW